MSESEAGIPPEFRTYSLEEVAEILSQGGRGLSVRTLQEYCKKGTIRAVKIGSSWRISHANLGLFLNGPDLAPRVSPPETEPAPARIEVEPAPAALPEPAKPQSPMSRARQALDELKRKLESERERREELLAAMRKPIAGALGQRPSRPADAAPSPAAPARAEPAAGPRSPAGPELTPGVSERSRELPTAADAAPSVADASSLAPASGASAAARPSPPMPDLSEILDDSADQGLAAGPGNLLPGEDALAMIDRPAMPEIDRLLEELESEPVLEPEPVPEETIEEETIAERGLVMRCELAPGAQGSLERHGAYESWYANGQQAARGAYSAGRLDGPWQQWHENGRVQCLGAHVEGLPNGPWTFWDDDGRKTQEVSYDRGRLDGLFAQYHPNGRLWCEGRYRDGLPEGSFRYWDAEGRQA